MAMGRQKTKNPGTLPYFFPREGKRGTTYYYTRSRPWVNLGRDYNEALRKWAEVEGKSAAGKDTIGYAAKEYFRIVVPTKAPATQKDNEREWAMLEPVFGASPFPQVKPVHVKQYIRGRSAKVRANREKALLSHIWNFAREEGLTDLPNPCAGIKGNKESGRDKYVEDMEYLSLYNAADDVLQDALDLMLFTGQRPADVLKMKRSDIRDGALWVTQNKTGHQVGITITGEFALIMDRILNRKRAVASLYLVANDQGQRITYWALDYRFRQARESADVDFQMRDLRAKNASDTDTVEEANTRLAHTTTNMTDKYRRKRKGKTVGPLK